MIPKIIHYIWFGGKPYSEKIQHCIDSWEKILPDYEFKLWNEESFDIESVPFTKEAYELKKWAFVSDYVRVWALQKFGGWYLDTDVEVLKPLAPFENNRMILGTDENGYLTALMGSEPCHPYWQQILDHYAGMKFRNEDGSLNTVVNNTYLQDYLAKYGYRIENVRQSLKEGIEVYPDDFFHVVNHMSGQAHLTKNSTAIHWHTLTWCPPRTRFSRFVRVKLLSHIIGPKAAEKMAHVVNNLLRK